MEMIPTMPGEKKTISRMPGFNLDLGGAIEPS